LTKQRFTRLPGPSPRPCLNLIAVLIVGIAICGCGKKKDARATPAETARRSLETALNAWQEGKAAGEIAGASPPIQVVDSVWLKGRKLTSFEILNEKTEADGVRSFSVRLNLAAPNATEEIQYIVKGISPVWVYRKEDHTRSQSWNGY
jgi:hypothetical protein